MGDMKKNLERIEKEICTICNKEPMSPQDVDNLKDLSEAYAKLSSSVGMSDYGRHMYGDESSLSSFRRGRSPITGQFISHAQMPMYDQYGNPIMNSNTYSYADNSMMANPNAYAGGYSGHSINDRMIASLEHMMSQTNDKYEQEQIRNEIEAIRRK